MCVNNRVLAISIIFVLFLSITSKVFSEPKDSFMFDFKKYDPSNWISVLDPKVKERGKFIQKDGFIQNFVKKEHKGKHSLAAGHTLKLLKDFSFLNGRIETEFMLVGMAAPSIYFRTQQKNGKHSETYNLVVFNFDSPKRKHYYGLNLWKWKEKWPADVKTTRHWIKLASWSFPVVLNKRHKIAVEIKGSYIKVFYNKQLKGTVYDSDPLKKGAVGICSCEGVNNFYNFKVDKK
jgi:hypothetical protein